MPGMKRSEDSRLLLIRGDEREKRFFFFEVLRRFFSCKLTFVLLCLLPSSRATLHLHDMTASSVNWFQQEGACSIVLRRGGWRHSETLFRRVKDRSFHLRCSSKFCVVTFRSLRVEPPTQWYTSNTTTTARSCFVVTKNRFSWGPMRNAVRK
jgi:hypothetical protein